MKSLLLALTLFLAVPAVAMATLPTAPQTVSDEGIAIRNMLEAGDMVIYSRYDLPITGITPSWASYSADDALVRFNNAGAPVQTRSAPAVDSSLTGFYLAPGHSITWESGTAQIEVMSNPVKFATNTTDSAAIEWFDTTGVVIDSSTDQTLVCERITTLLSAVNAASTTLAENALVDTNGNITTLGAQLVVAAFSQALSATPDCYPTGVDTTNIAFDPNSAQLQTDLQTEVEASDAWGRWELLSASWGFTDHVKSGSIFWVLFALIISVVAIAWSKSALFGLQAGVLVFFAAGLFIPAGLLQGIFIVVALMILGVGAFMFSRVPR